LLPGNHSRPLAWAVIGLTSFFPFSERAYSWSESPNCHALSGFGCKDGRVHWVPIVPSWPEAVLPHRVPNNHCWRPYWLWLTTWLRHRGLEIYTLQSFFGFFGFFWFFGSTGVWTHGLHLEPLHLTFFVMGFLFAWAGFKLRSSWSLPPEYLGLQAWATSTWLLQSSLTFKVWLFYLPHVSVSYTSGDRQ
jgi:hypothetical protein